MVDAYRAQVRDVLGQPVAVVEVQLKRTMFIDANVWEEIKYQIGDSGDGPSGGMEELKQFWQMASSLPADAFPYFTMPWTDADQSSIALLPLEEIARLTQTATYFRVEGSPDAYTGIFNVGGRERRIPMSLDTMPAFYQLVTDTRARAETQEASGDITSPEAQVIKDFCAAVGQTGANCENAMREKLRWQHERDKAVRDRIERDVQKGDFDNLKETHRGDFGPGVGRDAGGLA